MLRILALALAMLACAQVHAHKASDSYLTIGLDGSRIQGQWDIALRDLDRVLGLDANADGVITWGELRSRHADVAAYALSRLSLRANNETCIIVAGEQLVDRHSDGAYDVLRFTASCPKRVGALQIDYRMLFDVDAQHRGLLRLEHGGTTRTAIFSPDAPTVRFQVGEAERLGEFVEYLRHGIWHIWIGFDHILFLLSLLLPAVLVRAGSRWQPAPTFRAALLDVVSVVSAFTIAHSITLSAAALGVLSPPARWVESAIAASVALAALNNIVPVVSARRWALAFVFGLVHGFGFASVLIDLGLPRGTLLTALFAFNVGVELGQLAIVALFLPIAWRARATWAYRRVGVVAGSALVMCLALVWLAERALDLKL